jgi:hypothetical protein
MPVCGPATSGIAVIGAHAAGVVVKAIITILARGGTVAASPNLPGLGRFLRGEDRPGGHPKQRQAQVAQEPPAPEPHLRELPLVEIGFDVD